MDDATRTTIIIAAAQAAGPDAGDGNWGIAVSEKAASIAAMVSPHSPVSKLVTDMAEAKAFTATILEVKKEQSSTRALVSLKTRPSEHHPSGVEPARTDRTDNPSGLALARKMRELKYHRVMVWIAMEEVSGGSRKVRVLRHVEDLGIDTEVADVGADGTVTPKDEVVAELLAAFAAEK